MPFPEPARVPTVGEILPCVPPLTPMPNRTMMPTTTGRPVFAETIPALITQTTVAAITASRLTHEPERIAKSSSHSVTRNFQSRSD